MSEYRFNVFVCYKVNRIDYKTTISDMTVFFDAEVAFDCFFDRLNAAKDGGFIIDTESKFVKFEDEEDGYIASRYIEDEYGDAVYIDESSVFDEFKNGYVSITMFKGWQDNSDNNFDIVIECKQVMHHKAYFEMKKTYCE